MAVIQRADVPGGLAVRQEVVPVPSLKADVIVRGRMLAETMLLQSLRRNDDDVDESTLTERARKERDVRRGVEIICETLHLQIVLEDGASMWTAQEWEQHGAQHPGELLDLFKVAERLAGADTEALAKN